MKILLGAICCLFLNSSLVFSAEAANSRKLPQILEMKNEAFQVLFDTDAQKDEELPQYVDQVISDLQKDFPGQIKTEKTMATHSGIFLKQKSESLKNFLQSHSEYCKKDYSRCLRHFMNLNRLNAAIDDNSAGEFRVPVEHIWITVELNVGACHRRIKTSIPGSTDVTVTSVINFDFKKYMDQKLDGLRPRPTYGWSMIPWVSSGNKTYFNYQLELTTGFDAKGQRVTWQQLCRP